MTIFTETCLHDNIPDTIIQLFTEQTAWVTPIRAAGEDCAYSSITYGAPRHTWWRDTAALL